MYIMEYFTSFISYISIISPLSIFAKAKRSPVKINKWIMLGYNGINSLTNLYIVCGLIKYFTNLDFGLSIAYNQDIEYYIYLHYLTKYLDFFDTIFMILRQKWNQVNFLQLFHHSTIGVVWSYLLYNMPTDSASHAFGAFANSFIHFLMYLHYFVTTLGYKNPLKFMMTGLQMFQFVICFIHSIVWMRCHPDNIMFGSIQTMYMTAMVSLFMSIENLKKKL